MTRQRRAWSFFGPHSRIVPADKVDAQYSHDRYDSPGAYESDVCHLNREFMFSSVRVER